MERQPLWTRNFTILTLGTVVSMLGNAISGFALSLLILDYTGSTLLYAIFMVVYNLPKIIMPSIAGPYLDRFSRTKAIWTLDYLSAALYLVIFFLLRGGLFNYALLLGLCIVIGTIDSVYLVAYDSLYPMLISEGNYAKAYSISSMIYPLSALMVPIASWCYEHVGLTPLFLFNAATFAIAATFETQIRVKETQVSTTKEPYSLSRYKDDFKQGIAYLKQEKGLLVITAYFVVSMMVGNGSGTLILPYFKSQESLGVMTYTWVMGCSVLGRLVGGAVHYRFRYPTAKKFAIALFVYIVSALPVCAGHADDAPAIRKRAHLRHKLQHPHFLHAELCAQRDARPLQRHISNADHSGSNPGAASCRSARRCAPHSPGDRMPECIFHRCRGSHHVSWAQARGADL